MCQCRLGIFVEQGSRGDEVPADPFGQILRQRPQLAPGIDIEVRVIDGVGQFGSRQQLARRSRVVPARGTRSLVLPGTVVSGPSTPVVPPSTRTGSTTLVAAVEGPPVVAAILTPALVAVAIRSSVVAGAVEPTVVPPSR
ncbi:hypothetical protein AB8O38_03405 [Saccharomonospora xinjiangensis]|uniref:hypothetical protein n=1 Tax=Saccharomonospora xinjiangensis TaxID=75294 RepID=UPI003510A5B4